LDHLVLRDSDIPACISFYCDVLGCMMEKEHPDLGLYQQRAGGIVIDLLDVEGSVGRKGGPGPRREGHNVGHFYIRVEPHRP